MKSFKNNKGITMLELIVIVIMLIILITVVIDVLVNDGAVERAEEVIDEANDKILQGQEQESNVINNYQTPSGKTVIGTRTQNGNEKMLFPGERANENTPYKSNGKTAVIPERFYSFR